MSSQRIWVIMHLEQITASIECNNCVGESTRFELDKWLTSKEMKIHIQTDKFIASGFGDGYIRTLRTF